MLHVDDNTLFLTFTYIMMLNMFKFIDFFLQGEGGSGFIGTFWNL